MKEREFELSKITKFKVKRQEAGEMQLARVFSTEPETANNLPSYMNPSEQP
jgi:hypothetical protein